MGERPEPVTETARAMEHLREDLRDDINGLRADLRALVPREVFDLHRDGVKADIAAVRAELEREKADRALKEKDAATQQRSDRRLLFTALVAPAILLIVSIYTKAKGLT